MVKNTDMEVAKMLMGSRKPYIDFPYPCFHCDHDPFLTPELLRSHNNTEHSHLNVECQLCLSVFASWEVLRHHLVKYHELEEEVMYSQEARTMSEGMALMIQGEACIVTQVSKNKAKRHRDLIQFVGKGVFDGKQHKTAVNSKTICEVPNIVYKDYKVFSISEDGVKLIADSGDIREDIMFPRDEELRNQLMQGYEVGKQVVVTVVSAVGKQEICGVRVFSNRDFKLLDISNDGYLTLLDCLSSDLREDLKLPDDLKLQSKIKNGFSEGLELVVTLATIDGVDNIVGVKVLVNDEEEMVAIEVGP